MSADEFLADIRRRVPLGVGGAVPRGARHREHLARLVGRHLGSRRRARVVPAAPTSLILERARAVASDGEAIIAMTVRPTEGETPPSATDEFARLATRIGTHGAHPRSPSRSHRSPCSSPEPRRTRRRAVNLRPVSSTTPASGFVQVPELAMETVQDPRRLSVSRHDVDEVLEVGRHGIALASARPQSEGGDVRGGDALRRFLECRRPSRVRGRAAPRIRSVEGHRHRRASRSPGPPRPRGATVMALRRLSDARSSNASAAASKICQRLAGLDVVELRDLDELDPVELVVALRLDPLCCRRRTGSPR